MSMSRHAGSIRIEIDSLRKLNAEKLLNNAGSYLQGKHGLLPTCERSVALAWLTVRRRLARRVGRVGCGREAAGAVRAWQETLHINRVLHARCEPCFAFECRPRLQTSSLIVTRLS